MDRIRQFGYRGPHNPLQPITPAGLATSIQNDQFEEGIVVDIIVNNDHSMYATDGYNVGMVKFRKLVSNAYKSESRLDWAYPMDANHNQYPLIGELVYIFRGLNRWFYLSKFNTSNRVTAQDLPELLTETEVSAQSKTVSNYRQSAAAPKLVGSPSYALGKYFRDLPDVYRLKHFEGDLTIEGRSGQSIRMGTAWLDGSSGITARPKKISWQSLEKDQSPNLLIRVGPDPTAERTVDTTFGQVIEDINKDKTSLWMVTDQIVPIKLSTLPSKIHTISIHDFPKKFDGNCAFLNSDRVVINTKTDKFLLHSANGVHVTTLKNITLDADVDHISWTSNNRNDRVVGNYTETIGKIKSVSAMTHINFLSSKIYIGSSQNEDEPLVLGATLQKALQELVEILTSEPLVLTTGMPGSPSPQSPKRILKLNQWKQKYLSGGKSAKILSIDNFTIRNNDSPRKISPYKEG